MTRSSLVKLLTVLLFVSLSLVILTPALSAQDTSSTPPASSTVTPNEVKEVAKELWCPLCSGVRLDACELKACEQMREVIAVKLSEGVSDQEIKNYFVAQYGPQVLGEPPMEGFNWLAWLLPVAVVIGGGVFLWFRARSMIGAKAQAAENTAAASAPSGGDDLSRKLDEELKHYD